MYLQGYSLENASAFSWVLQLTAASSPSSKCFKLSAKRWAILPPQIMPHLIIVLQPPHDHFLRTFCPAIFFCLCVLLLWFADPTPASIRLPIRELSHPAAASQGRQSHPVPCGQGKRHNRFPLQSPEHFRQGRQRTQPCHF